MNIQVFIAPHERREAMEAYRQWLTPGQDYEITSAPDSAIICLERRDNKTVIRVIEEG